MLSTQAIILKREDFRERDERIFLYTKDLGRITIVARGIRRIEAKLRGNLDIFNLVDIIFVEGASFPILTGVEMHKRFENLSRDISSYRAALAATNIVLYTFEERAKDNFFGILYTALNKLDEFSALYGPKARLYSWLLLKKFQLAVLHEQGYDIENSHSLITMLQYNSGGVLSGEGAKYKNANIAEKDFREVEESICRAFAYHFNYKIPKWLPIEN